MRKTRFRGQARVAWILVFALSVYNVLRVTNLMEGLK
jgi:hypothetical protein